MSLSASGHRKCFDYLTQVLSRFKPLWSESAFVREQLSWRGEYPELYRDLTELSVDKLESLGAEEALLDFLTPYAPALAEVRRWKIQRLNTSGWSPPERASFGVPGRKQNQIAGFVATLVDSIPKDLDAVVDWCSGQGYLARQLHYALDCPVLCLERDASLCAKGTLNHEKLDRSMASRVRFEVQDVLQSVDREHFQRSTLHTALHACGSLHLSMLRQGVENRVGVLACSPCCFHLMEETNYDGLSSVAQASKLRLTREQLRLATAELCTANSLERKLRDRELLWRVAFDLRHRQVTGIQEYRPTPSVKKSLLKKSFGEYATWMAQRIQGPTELFLFTPDEEATLFQQAGSKLQRIKRLEKAQLGFRKVLELWLLLDRVLFLQESGYETRLLEFCEKRDSGRNVMIFASRLSALRF